MKNSKSSFALQLFTWNLPWIGTLFALHIGFWTMEITFFAALTSQVDNLSITIWCWIFIVGWMVYFVLIFDKLYREQKEKSKEENEKAQKSAKDAQDLAEKEKKVAKDRAEKAKKKAEAHQDQITFQNETNKKLSELTADQSKNFQSLNSEIETVKKAQASLESQINSNQVSLADQIEKDCSAQMRELLESIDAVHDKMDATPSGKNCNHNESNSNQFPEESIRRASSYSSKSL